MADIKVWKELLEAAKIVEGWTAGQRKLYLAKLRKREKAEGKTLYRNLFKIMLTDTKRRKYFINFVKSGKHKT